MGKRGNGEGSVTRHGAGRVAAAGKPKHSALIRYAGIARNCIVQTMDTYSHPLENIGGDAIGGLDEAFG